jgi:hypothetical protein
VKNLATVSVDMSKKTLFPFAPPQIKIELKEATNESYISLFDLQHATFEDIMKEHWHPSIKLGDIIEKTTIFIEKYMVPIEKVPGKIIKRVHGKDSLLKLFATVFFAKFAFTIL